MNDDNAFKRDLKADVGYLVDLLTHTPNIPLQGLAVTSLLMCLEDISLEIRTLRTRVAILEEVLGNSGTWDDDGRWVTVEDGLPLSLVKASPEYKPERN